MIQRYDKSCLTLTEILDFQIYINYVIGLKAGNNSCRRISDKPFHTTQQDQINKPYIKEINALFGSDKDLERTVESAGQMWTCGNLSMKTKVVLRCLGEWQRHAKAFGLCKHMKHR